MSPEDNPAESEWSPTQEEWSMTDQENIQAVEGHVYSPDCNCQRCFDHLHDCSICRGCELKPGCQTEPNFGCQGVEKARRHRLPPPCRLCGEPTPIVFNIRLRAVPICQSCASAITRQEVAGRRDSETNAADETVPLEIVDPKDAHHPQSPHWGSMVSPVAQKIPADRKDGG